MSLPTVALLYGRIDPNAPADEADTLVQVDAVRGALSRLGHPVIDVPVGLDLAAVADALTEAARPGGASGAAPSLIAFNLVESLDGKGCLIHLAPALLDGLGIPYTGAPSEAVMITSQKLLTKKALAAAGIPTPPWVTARQALESAPQFDGPWIVKSVWEHASVGMQDSSIAASHRDLTAEIRRRCLRERQEGLFVEGFVDGREFNLALLGGRGDDGPQNFPPAEIRFVDYPAGKPRVVGYKAKWDAGSFEYVNTPRTFDFPPEDEELLSKLEDLSRECWRLFDLRGYARVDFRVDLAGRPWVLEVNANPCISPDAGFMAAADRAGLTLEDVVRRIIADAGEPEPRAEERHR
jgi:D-alanine-D-alanine ligase